MRCFLPQLSQLALTCALSPARYVDIEFGGGRSVFYDRCALRLRERSEVCVASCVSSPDGCNCFARMNIRYSIGQMLEYLWQVPGHAASWRTLAAAQAR
jgi:hypothetical protein